MKMVIGDSAGHHFNGTADLTVSYHVTRTLPDGKVEQGYFLKRKWLASLGWAYDHWFEWI